MVKPRRNKKGQIISWPGGKTAGKKGDKTWHGTRIRLGREFKRQRKRKAKPGDIVRDRDKDGSYNRSSPWHIFTRFGWRKSPSGKKKPAKSTITRTLEGARKGR